MGKLMSDAEVREALARQRGPEEPVELVLHVRCHDPREAADMEAALRRAVDDRGWLSQVGWSQLLPLAEPQVPGGFRP